jgi:hypothetical protein
VLPLMLLLPVTLLSEKDPTTMVSGLGRASCPQQGAGLHQLQGAFAPWGSQAKTEKTSTPRQTFHVIKQRMVLSSYINSKGLHAQVCSDRLADLWSAGTGEP